MTKIEEKLKKYNVIFAMSYTIEAKDEAEAEEKAIEEFEKEFPNGQKVEEALAIHVEDWEEEI